MPGYLLDTDFCIEFLRGRDDERRSVGSGVYLYRIETHMGRQDPESGEFVETKKLVLIR